MKAQCNSGCPKCARAQSGHSKDGVRQKRPTFASCHHPLLSQWDHSLNERRVTTLTTPHLAATTSSGGHVINVQKATSIAGKPKPCQELASKRVVVLTALAVKYVTAIHCKLFTLILQLTLTLLRMA